MIVTVAGYDQRAGVNNRAVYDYFINLFLHGVCACVYPGGVPVFN